jgi:hypothetical protein
MARIRDRAKRILEEARQPLTEAEALLEVRSKEALAADTAFNTQGMIVGALHEAYSKLEKALAPQPRQSMRATTKSVVKKPVATKPSRKKRTAAVGLCTACEESESSGIHDPAMGYRNYHPFQPSSVARNAQPKSETNGAGSNGTANSETRMEDAGIAAHGASGD